MNNKKIMNSLLAFAYLFLVFASAFHYHSISIGENDYSIKNSNSVEHLGHYSLYGADDCPVLSFENTFSATIAQYAEQTTVLISQGVITINQSDNTTTSYYLHTPLRGPPSL